MLLLMSAALAAPAPSAPAPSAPAAPSAVAPAAPAASSGQASPSGPAVVAAPAPVDARALATAREIIRVGYPEEKRVGMFTGVLDAMTGQMRAAMMPSLNNDPAAKAMVERKLDGFIPEGKAVMIHHIPAFMEAYAQGYAREFSQDELEQMLTFARTPAGQHFFLRSSAIIADPAFAAANQAYIRELQPLIEKMQRELVAELTAYFMKNPPKPSGNS